MGALAGLLGNAVAIVLLGSAADVLGMQPAPAMADAQQPDVPRLMAAPVPPPVLAVAQSHATTAPKEEALPSLLAPERLSHAHSLRSLPHDTDAATILKTTGAALTPLASDASTAALLSNAASIHPSMNKAVQVKKEDRDTGEANAAVITTDSSAALAGLTGQKKPRTLLLKQLLPSPGPLGLATPLPGDAPATVMDIATGLCMPSVTHPKPPKQPKLEELGTAQCSSAHGDGHKYRHRHKHKRRSRSQSSSLAHDPRHSGHDRGHRHRHRRSKSPGQMPPPSSRSQHGSALHVPALHINPSHHRRKRFRSRSPSEVGAPRALLQACPQDKAQLGSEAPYDAEGSGYRAELPSQLTAKGRETRAESWLPAVDRLGTAAREAMREAYLSGTFQGGDAADPDELSVDGLSMLPELDQVSNLYGTHGRVLIRSLNLVHVSNCPGLLQLLLTESRAHAKHAY